jgi:hypothetical protein
MVKPGKSLIWLSFEKLLRMTCGNKMMPLGGAHYSNMHIVYILDDNHQIEYWFVVWLENSVMEATNSRCN